MSAPRMITLVAPELEKTFLGSFLDLKLLIIPLVVVVVAEESSECFLRGPSHWNPLKLLLRHSRERLKHLNGELSVNIILNLFDRRVRSKILSTLYLCTLVLSNRHLKPVSYFKNIPSFQIFILVVRLSFFISLFRLLSNRF